MTSNRWILIPLLGMLLASLLVGRPAYAQYPYGKNKVVYSGKKWKVLKTDHVDIYYYPDEQNLVLFAAPLVEETFLEYADIFDFEFEGRLPLVLFSSHYDFQQTHIVTSMISEYTAGFTDLAKGRIAIPFAGTLWEFRHVIRHEMVHAFMLKKLSAVMSEHGKIGNMYPPLWFVEGLAEYVANPHGDSRGHMFLRDAMMHNRLPDLMNIWRIQGSFLMYKEGEAVVRYIADNFGDEALVQILENWWRIENFSMILEQTINMNLLELNDAFFKAMKRRYYPSILNRQFVRDLGDQITEPHTFHSRPAAGRTREGDIVVYATGAHDGVICIVKFDRDKKGKLRRKVLIEGSLSTTFESIPAFRSKMEVRGDTLLFVSKRHEKDAIYLWHTKRKRLFGMFTFDGLSVISSPTLSPEGERIVFSAIDETGQLDLFLYDIPEDTLERLTDDTFAEQDADFHPTLNRVIFASDRCRSSSGANQGIYMVDAITGRITPLTCGAGKDAYPDWAPNGKSFLFSSDRDGVFNIYEYNMGTHTITKQTNVLGGVTMPSFLPDQSGFVASAFSEGEYHIYDFPLKTGEGLMERVVAFDETATGPNWRKRPAEDFTYTTENYKQKLAIDFAGAGVAIDPNFGTIGNGGQIVLTDILGNHQYFFFFGNSSYGMEDFFRRLNFGGQYVNLTHRLHYSLGAFHLNSYVRDNLLGFRAEKRVGASVGLSYPLSKFTRVDASVVGRYVERETAYEQIGLKKSWVATAFFSHVVDKTLWTIGGPLKGWRYYVTVGHTADFQDRGFENTVLHFEVRKYFKVTRRIVLAHRFLTRNTFGSDFELFYLGGPWDLRGYDFREFMGRSTYLINNEVRFPLIDRFVLGLPFGTIETPRFRGSFFFDMGMTDRWIINTNWLGSFGAGVELNLGYAPVIRVNFTRATNFSTISKSTKLEMFIGYNY